MADKGKGRGRLTAIDLLPSECDEAITLAAAALAGRERTQAEIYAEFEKDLRRLQKELGRIFPIPSKSAFNRYSLRLAVLSRQLEQTREIAATLASRFDAEASDDLTLIVAETIKSVVFDTLSGGGTMEARDLQALGNALKSALAAQSLSTNRRQKVETAQLAKQTIGKALDSVEAKAESAGSQELIKAIRAKIFGIAEE